MPSYYGNQFSGDELEHFKYIRRVKGPNGKYRYYYADKDGHRDVDWAMRSLNTNLERKKQINSDLRFKMASGYMNSKLADSTGRGFTIDQKSYGIAARKQYDSAAQELRNLDGIDQLIRTDIDTLKSYTIGAQASAAYKKIREKGKSFLSRFIKR